MSRLWSNFKLSNLHTRGHKLAKFGRSPGEELPETNVYQQVRARLRAPIGRLTTTPGRLTFHSVSHSHFSRVGFVCLIVLALHCPIDFFLGMCWCLRFDHLELPRSCVVTPFGVSVKINVLSRDPYRLAPVFGS